MKILFADTVGNPYKPGDGGTSDTIWNMAIQANLLGHEGKIIAPYLSHQFPHPIVPVFVYSIPNWARRNIIGTIYNYLSLAVSIRKINNGYELIHTRDYLGAAILSRLCSLPVVVTVAGNPLERKHKNLPYFDPVTSIFYLLASKLVARSPDCYVIATSEDMYRWWSITGVKSDHLFQMPLGVDTNLFSYRSNDRDHVNWSNNINNLLYVGRLIPKLKGLEELIEALIHIKAVLPMHLHLVGNGNYLLELQELISKNGLESDVTFHGWVGQKDLPDYYSAADLCILPSKSEGFGRTMLESMSCGLPFMGSKVGGMADHIIDGVNGFVLDEINSEIIAKKTIAVFQNRELLEIVANKAREYICENFDWSIIMKKISNQIYLEIIEQRSI